MHVLNSASRSVLHLLLLALLMLLSAPVRTQAEDAGLRTRLDQIVAQLRTQPEQGLAELDGLLAEMAAGPASALHAEALMHRCNAGLGVDAAAMLPIAERGLVMDTLASLPVRAGLLVCRGYAHETAGRMDLALVDYTRSAELAEQAGDRSAMAQAKVLRGEILHYQGSYADAIEQMQTAYRIYLELDNAAQQRYVLNATANLYADARVGEYDKALELYRQVLASHEAEQRTQEIATAEFNIASTLERKGDLAGALEHFQRSLRLTRELGDPSEVADVERATAVVLLKLKRPQRALPLLEAALRQFEAEANPTKIAHTRLTRGSVLAALGQVQPALADLEASQAWYEQNDNPRFLERIHLEKAELLAAAGQWQRAYAERMTAVALGERLAAQLREEQSARLRTQFDSERRDQENAALRREQELSAQALAAAARVRTLQTTLIVLAALILLGFGLLIAKLRNKNKELQASNESLAQSREQVVSSGKRADLIFKALTESLAGTVLDDKYRIEARVGAGGFGTVYRALQLHLGTTVAVKVFKPIPGQDALKALNRFRSEGISAYRVQHRHAVRVLDFGVSMETVAYLVMEFLEGVSLADELHQHGPMHPARVVAILYPICAALACAHAAGVVHRDVKPSNILLCHEDDQEVVKLIDFGIAKVLDHHETPAEVRDLTGTGMYMGTPNYMAPERFVLGPYDGRSDVYSLGVVGFEMLTGMRPFEESGAQPTPVALQHLHQSLPDLGALVPDAPPALLQLITLALAKHATTRPDAETLAARLRELYVEIIGEEPVSPGELDTPRTPQRALPRSHEDQAPTRAGSLLETGQHTPREGGLA